MLDSVKRRIAAAGGTGAEVLEALPVRRMARAGPGRLWLSFVVLSLGVKPYVPLLARLRFPVRIPGGRTMWLADISELRVLSEVFVSRIYDLPALPTSAARILDLGANIGAASAFLAGRFPTAEIVAYEADPLVAERARSHLRGLRVDVHAAAICDHHGQLELRRSPGASWATGQYINDGEPFVTPAVTLDEVIGDRPVDILKIDIEGSEYAAIRACTRLSLARVLLGEFHPVGDVTAARFYDLLEGFDVVYGADQPKGTFIAVRRPEG
jgi:FkbM family methyltransferase